MILEGKTIDVFRRLYIVNIQFRINPANKTFEDIARPDLDKVRYALGGNIPDRIHPLDGRCDLFGKIIADVFRPVRRFTVNIADNRKSRGCECRFASSTY